MNTSCFYISGMTEDEKGGIFRCQWSSGSPQVMEFTPLRRNSFLAWGRERKTLYASMQQADGSGGVAAYRVNSDGSLAYLNTVMAGGSSVCYLEMSPDGKYLYSANYASGNVSEFLLADDGSIVKLLRAVPHFGCGVRTEQRSPHPHCCTFTPDGKYLCVADLGIDRVVLYPYEPVNGINTAAAEEILLPPGSGPRHLVFDASGQKAFLLCELGNVLFSFNYAAGKLTETDKISTLPPGCSSGSAAAIRFAPEGRFIFASNRGSNTIAVFTFDGAEKLVPAGYFPAGGASPRDFNFLPDAGVAAIANEFSGETVFFVCAPDKGTIAERLGSLTLPRPLYVLK